MRVCWLAITTNKLACGFSGGSAVFETQTEFDFSEINKFQLQKVLLKAVRSLLIDPKFLTIVIAEPTLFNLETKKLLAYTLFSFNVGKIGFLNQSVCCVLGNCVSKGVYYDTIEEVYVPVYDFRELTTIISTDYKQCLDKMNTDLRAALANTEIIDLDFKSICRGLSALSLKTEVWPLLTYPKFQKSGVWDSLYNVR